MNDRSDELCRIFSTTVSSLATDASALRDLSQLEKACRMDLQRDDEKPSQPSVTDMLQQIDAAVTSLEGKTRMLLEIVAEEKRSLDELQDVYTAAEAQRQVLDLALQARNETSDAPTTTSRKDNDAAVHDEEPPPAPRVATNTSVLSRPIRRRRDSMDPRQSPRPENDSKQGHSIRLPRVTPTEYNKVSRTIRGRITLAVANDALVDIERVLRNKNATRERHPLKPNHQDGHSNIVSREQLSVSEQELRKNCAFFRSGESSARAILLLLRTLGRLKQVPGKHSEVKYICLL